MGDSSTYKRPEASKKWKWKLRRCGDTKAEPPGRLTSSQDTRMGATQGRSKTGLWQGRPNRLLWVEAPAFPSLKAQM